MQRSRTSTSAHLRAIGFDARTQACRDARAWLGRSVRWDDRLTELHALARPGGDSQDFAPGRRAAQACSGVLERPGRSAEVCA